MHRGSAALAASTFLLLLSGCAAFRPSPHFENRPPVVIPEIADTKVTLGDGAVIHAENRIRLARGFRGQPAEWTRLARPGWSQMRQSGPKTGPPESRNWPEKTAQGVLNCDPPSAHHNPMTAPADSSLAYQDLQPHDILASVESLGYCCDGRFLALNSYENRVYRVGIEDEPPVVAKFYRPGRWTDEAILEEHAFATELAQQEIPVVAPVAHEGNTLHHYGAFRFAVYPCLGGRPPELDDMSLLRQLGRFVARIHLCGEVEPFAHRPELDLASFGEASHDYLLEAGFIPEDLEPAYTSTCEHLFEGIRSCYGRAGAPRRLRLHGDFHPSNVLVRDDQMHIVDLDDIRMGPAVQDLWMFLSGDRAEQTPQLDELLSGYEEFRGFDARELHLIEALRTLRIMHYAAWLARRWRDPAFQHAFPWFNSRRYWDEHVLALREQAALMEEEPLAWMGP